MTMKPKSLQPGLEQEDGFLLLGVLFMILLVLLALAIAAPKMAEDLRRDKEIETVHRGQQYVRAIQIYYTKYGRYPNTIDQLIKSDNQRFLRKRYLDPMTGKDDWRIIHYGEQKVPAMGLFGQTVQQAGLTPGVPNANGVAGSIGSSSAYGSSGSSIGGSGSAFGSSGSSIGGSSFGSSGSSIGGGSSYGSQGSSVGNNGFSLGSSSSSGSSIGGSSGSMFGNSGSSTSPAGGTDPSTGGGIGSSTGIGGTTTTATGGTTGTTIGGTTTTGSSSAFGSPGASFGGAPIVGVGLLSKKLSIKIYKKQKHYNEWEFVYDNTQGVGGAAGGITQTGATTASGTNGTTGTGFGSGTGSGFGSTTGSGFGSSSGSGFGSGSGSGFGSSSGSGSGSGSGFGSSNGNGFGGSPASPVSPTMPVSNAPQ
jgi:type II secretory pathway pseudopilin PulG